MDQVSNSDAPGESRRRRNRLSQAPYPRGSRAQGRRRALRISPPRDALSQEDSADCPRGNGPRGRARDRLADPPARGALAYHWPLGHDGSEHVQAPRPRRARVRARSDGRGGVHRFGKVSHQFLPPAARHDLPDTVEVPRRDAPALRPHALQGISNEGRLLLRHGRRWR